MSSQKRRHWTAEEELQIQAFRKSLSKKEGAEGRKIGSTVSGACPRACGGMPAIRDRHWAVLRLGEACPTGSSGSSSEREAWKEEDKKWCYRQRWRDFGQW
jgi:hypothetical protein